MTIPKNRYEYLARFAANQKITGFGSEVKTHFPCPFCAAPDWMIHPITDGLAGYPVIRAIHHCGECGRSARVNLQNDGAGISFEFVQTGGDDQPDWLQPQMRRDNV